MKNYSPVHIAYLREGYKHMNLDELTMAFNQEFKVNKQRGQIKAALKNHGLCVNKPRGGGKPHLLTLEQEYFIAELYRVMPCTGVTDALNKHYKTSFTIDQINHYMRNHKIRSGRTGQFTKGALPWNTGTKGVMKVNSGSFKKGSLPANTRELGAERVCSKDGYVLVKVAEKNPYTKAKTRFRHKHQVIWEKHHGKKLPKGQVITFLNGDKRNFDPKNLVAVNRNLLCRYNQNHANELPKELIPTMKSVINLKQKIHERSAELERKKQ